MKEIGIVLTTEDVRGVLAYLQGDIVSTKEALQFCAKALEVAEIEVGKESLFNSTEIFPRIKRDYAKLLNSRKIKDFETLWGKANDYIGRSFNLRDESSYAIDEFVPYKRKKRLAVVSLL